MSRKSKPPDRQAIEKKLDEIGQGSEPPIRDDEVTAVIDCALERLQHAMDRASNRPLREAAEGLQDESARATTHERDSEVPV